MVDLLEPAILTNKTKQAVVGPALDQDSRGSEETASNSVRTLVFNSPVSGQAEGGSQTAAATLSIPTRKKESQNFVELPG